MGLGFGLWVVGVGGGWRLGEGGGYGNEKTACAVVVFIVFVYG